MLSFLKRILGFKLKPHQHLHQHATGGIQVSQEPHKQWPPRRSGYGVVVPPFSDTMPVGPAAGPPTQPDDPGSKRPHGYGAWKS